MSHSAGRAKEPNVHSVEAARPGVREAANRLGLDYRFNDAPITPNDTERAAMELARMASELETLVSTLAVVFAVGEEEAEAGGLRIDKIEISAPAPAEPDWLLIGGSVGLGVGVMVGVGAAFDYHAGAVPWAAGERRKTSSLPLGQGAVATERQTSRASTGSKSPCRARNERTRSSFSSRKSEQVA